MKQQQDQAWMQQAIELAQAAEKAGEVPVGAIVVQNNQIIGRGFNQPISACDPTAHAEVVALRDAAKYVNNYRIPNATLYCTLEPCSMCAGAIIQARIERVVYGAQDLRAGAVETLFTVLSHPEINHHPELKSGVCKERCIKLLTDFFKNKR